MNVSFADSLPSWGWVHDTKKNPKRKCVTIPIIHQAIPKSCFLPSLGTPNPFNPCRSRRAAAACPQAAEGYMKWPDSLVKQEQRKKTSMVRPPEFSTQEWGGYWMLLLTNWTLHQFWRVQNSKLQYTMHCLILAIAIITNIYIHALEKTKLYKLGMIRAKIK